jgi:hypothetical protein
MIVLITPTGARPQQFQMCATWMIKQTYSNSVVWVIIDDAFPISTNSVNDNFRSNWTVVKIYPKPLWAGQNTQARNIRAGIKYIMDSYKKEDYRPIYLDRMMSLLKNHWIIGETNTIYYNVITRRFVINPNKSHASLFQSAFSWEALPYFENCYYHPFIDCVLWNIVPNKYLFFDNYLSIGMKGMPGRGGIGAGHKRVFSMMPDLDMSYLKRLIGEEDAKHYEGYYGDYGKPQHTLFAKKRL